MSINPLNSSNQNPSPQTASDENSNAIETQSITPEELNDRKQLVHLATLDLMLKYSDYASAKDDVAGGQNPTQKKLSEFLVTVVLNFFKEWLNYQKEEQSWASKMTDKEKDRWLLHHMLAHEKNLVHDQNDTKHFEGEKS